MLTEDLQKQSLISSQKGQEQVNNWHCCLLPLIILVLVPLVAVFTKFDGLVVNEYCELHHIQNGQAKWEEARKNAENTFQKHYLHQMMTVQNHPKAFVKLEGKTFHCDTS
jgi:hypothetical protein